MIRMSNRIVQHILMKFVIIVIQLLPLKQTILSIALNLYSSNVVLFLFHNIWHIHRIDENIVSGDSATNLDVPKHG